MEDVDSPRTVPGATERILQQLSDCGLDSDETVILQSTRSPLYQRALEQLMAHGLVYACTCSRKDIAAARQQQGLARVRHGELVYPGTCRPHHWRTPSPAQHHLNPNDTACAWRLRTDFQIENKPLARVEYAQAAITKVAKSLTQWQDRRLGLQQQDVASEVGDFVLKRADGCFTYQLAVVVDDAAQGITHVVRGVDLTDNTPRQIFLQRALGLPTPLYLHTPLVLGAHGEKLSKQNGAVALDTSGASAALHALRQAARVLGLPPAPHGTIQEALATWVAAWRVLYCAAAPTQP
jgi:glutamyl-Q tRNA(Asp) synthetase